MMTFVWIVSFDFFRGIATDQFGRSSTMHGISHCSCLTQTLHSSTALIRSVQLSKRYDVYCEIFGQRLRTSLVVAPSGVLMLLDKG